MGGKFEVHVRSLLADNAGLSRIILPLLEAWRSLRLQAARLGKQLLAEARRNQHCQLLMSIPGIGAINQAEVDYDGHISRRGAACEDYYRSFIEKGTHMGVLCRFGFNRKTLPARISIR
jgi:hypothetical protein